MWTEKQLDNLLTTPSQNLIDAMRAITGDILILGAGGKMGPTLAILAARARRASQTDGRIIAVSRFSNPAAAELLRAGGCGDDPGRLAG